jgi:hypothetical protein
MKKIKLIFAIFLAAFTVASFSAHASNQIENLKNNATVFTAYNPHIVLNRNHTTFSVVLARKDTDDYVWKITNMPEWLIFVSHTTTYTPYDKFNAVETFTFQLNNSALNSVYYGHLDFSLKHADNGIINWENKHFSITVYPEF